MDLQQQRQLQADNQLLQQQVGQLTAQLAVLNAPAVPPPRRKCPVAVPDKFSGQPEMFQVFQGQCQLFMSMRPEDFPDNQAKVGFVISLLSGSATRWATPLLTQDSPLLMDYGVFCQHMCLMYEDPIRTQTDVFSEQEVDWLPPHRPSDCPVDLLPNALLPVGRLYSMFEPELAALREFLDKNLA
uniref:DUF4939 domain-containing protein n=1 Tax=Naja naja TaxID=35670 RepID=A0A8C6YFM8_NAJNA